MILETSFEDHDTHLLASVRGEWTSTAATDTLQFIMEKAQQTSKTRVLLDIINLSAPSSEFDRYLSGVDIARMFPRPSRVAIVYRSELINKFVENTAVNLGAQLLVCDSREEALRYLLDDEPSSGA